VQEILDGFKAVLQEMVSGVLMAAAEAGAAAATAAASSTHPPPVSAWFHTS
jgi:hypothetical protein